MVTQKKSISQKTLQKKVAPSLPIAKPVNRFWKFLSSPFFIPGLYLLCVTLLTIIGTINQVYFPDHSHMSWSSFPLYLLIIAIVMPSSISQFSLSLFSVNIGGIIALLTYIYLPVAAILSPIYYRYTGKVLRTVIIIAILLILLSFAGCVPIMLT